MTEPPTGEPAARVTPEPATAPLAPDGPGPLASVADDPSGASGTGSPRRRGSRGGRSRSRPRPDGVGIDGVGIDGVAPSDDRNPELPDTPREGRPRTVEAADSSLVRRPAAEAARRPQIGDTMPVPTSPPPRPASAGAGVGAGAGGAGPDGPKRKRRRGGRGRGSGSDGRGNDGRGTGRTDQNGTRAPRQAGSPVEAVLPTGGLDLDDDVLESRRGRERKGRPVGRYLMCVHVDPTATQIAVLEGRNLIEHYVARPADDVAQIHGNIYLGRVQNVLPGMEAAFIDISTPKNAVLYRGDVHFDADDVEGGGSAKPGNLRIEQLLKAKQTIICRSPRTRSVPRVPASPRRCRCRAASSC